MTGLVVLAAALVMVLGAHAKPLEVEGVDYFYFTLSNGTTIKENLKSSDAVEAKSVALDKLHFFLYKSAGQPFELHTGDKENLKNSGFDSKVSTKVLIHGYTNSYLAESVQMIKDAYLASGHYNVIICDYEAYNSPYLSAVGNARDIGHHIGNLLSFLIEAGNLKLSDIHIIGHSLGAHIASYSTETVNGLVARVTGLDPAGPLFGTKKPENRLDVSDAHYVDVIHSSESLGMKKVIGTDDFYPSYGKGQPRCTLVGGAAEVFGACDHAQSYKFFAETVRDKTLYPATPCSHENIEKSSCSGKTTSYMGEGAVNQQQRGVFYVNVDHSLQF